MFLEVEEQALAQVAVVEVLMEEAAVEAQGLTVDSLVQWRLAQTAKKLANDYLTVPDVAAVLSLSSRCDGILRMANAVVIQLDTVKVSRSCVCWNTIYNNCNLGSRLSKYH